MSARISPDEAAPTAGVEIPITRPLPDFDLNEIAMPTPRDVDPILASQGFKDLLDDARAVLERELAGQSLALVQLTGAICHDAGGHRPGIWLVLREAGAPERQPMSPGARVQVAAIAENLRSALGLS